MTLVTHTVVAFQQVISYFANATKWRSALRFLTNLPGKFRMSPIEAAFYLLIPNWTKKWAGLV